MPPKKNQRACRGIPAVGWPVVWDAASQYFPEVEMKITADILEQARENLVEFAQQRITLIAAIKEQGRKIFDLEREVQKQMTRREQAEQALAAARTEIEAL